MLVRPARRHVSWTAMYDAFHVPVPHTPVQTEVEDQVEASVASSTSSTLSTLLLHSAVHCLHHDSPWGRANVRSSTMCGRAEAAPRAKAGCPPPRRDTAVRVRNPCPYQVRFRAKAHGAPRSLTHRPHAMVGCALPNTHPALGPPGPAELYSVSDASAWTGDQQLLYALLMHLVQPRQLGPSQLGQLTLRPQLMPGRHGRCGRSLFRVTRPHASNRVSWGSGQPASAFGVVLPPHSFGQKGGSCMDRSQSTHDRSCSRLNALSRSAGHGPAVTMPHTPLHAPHFSFLGGANVAAPQWRRAREYPNLWGLAGTETPGWFVRGRCICIQAQWAGRWLSVPCARVYD
jgi:hypothetical protein